ncbi:MAG TPA: bifunctional DNA primase/polymerase [Brevundimonas sp.]|nr:bifunctional DNA primase/polymerase [Brevundimonas sp.]
MTDATAASPFASAAPDLISLGYSPIPLIAHDWPSHAGRGKCPGEYRSGAWQGMSKWQRFRDSTPSAFEMGLWSKAPGANIGLLMGTVARKDLHVVSLDFDAKDPDALDTLLRAAPASPMVKRGAKGETRFYLAPKTLKSKPYDGPDGRLLDLLTGFDTRQTVIPPSIHPDTGKPYVWLAGPVRADELPVLTDEDMQALEEALEQCGWNRERRSGRERKPYTAPAEGGVSDDPLADIKRDALANLDAWVGDLSQIGGLRRARGGWEAVDLSRSSSSGRADADRKRNLSMQRAGIKDFGDNSTYSAIDLVMRQEGLSVGEAASWLEDRLNPSGVVIDLEASTACADKKGPAPTASRAEEEAEAGPVVAEETAAQEVHHTPALRTTHGVELPRHLIDGCPGLVGYIAEYVTATARKPQPTLALATALTVVGTAAGRRYAGPTGAGTHLYIVMLAKSGAGKDHPLDMAARLLEAAEMGHHVGPSEFMSNQAVFKAVSRQPLLLSPMDELGSWLKKIGSRKAAGNENAITGVLRTLWGKSFSRVPVPGWATQDMPPIYAPAFSILGAATPEEFFQSLEAGASDNGFLNRWILFSTGTRPAVQRPSADKFEVPDNIKAGLSEIYNVGGAMTRATLHNGRADKAIVTAEWEGGEGGPLEAEYLRWAAQMDDAGDGESFYARVAEQALRLSTIRAIGSDAHAPVIDRACFEWGRDIALWATAAMLAQAGDHMAENQTQADRSRVLRAIRKAGAITHRDLTRKLTTFKARELDDIVKGLEIAELISVALETHPINGKKTRRYTFIGDAA